MPRGRREGGRWLVLILGLLLLGWVSPPAPGQQPKPGRQQSRPGSQTTGEPISKAGLLEAVKLAAQARNPKQRAELMGYVIEQVRSLGVDFYLTTEDEGELRAAGASPELLAAVRLKSEDQADILALRDWKAIKESRQAADFEAHLKKFPKSEFAALARERFEQLEWDAIKTSEKAADFEAFLKKLPSGKFSATARERLEQLEWEAIKASDKTADFEAYLKKYPEGKSSTLARERIEALEWEAIKASDKTADFEAYLKKYPEGKFAASARERNEQLAWDAIKASDKASDFEAYLKKYPAGKFSATARERMGRLTAASSAGPPRPAADGASRSQESPGVKLVFWSPEELKRQAIKTVTPTYPRRALEARVRGLVRVRVDVSEAGRVLLAEALSGPVMLHDAAEQAARQWVFRPAEHAGATVKAQGVITFNFAP